MSCCLKGGNLAVKGDPNPGPHQKASKNLYSSRSKAPRVIDPQTLLGLLQVVKNKEWKVLLTISLQNPLLSDGEIWTAHGAVNPCGLVVWSGESKAKNSKVAHEYAEHREHGEFILVRASGE
jgi:hypothetical protein